MDNMLHLKDKDLQSAALAARRNLFVSLGILGSGHYGACLSEIELLTYLYFEEMRIDPARPDWEHRDRFVLSKGHGGFGLYAVLAERGFMPRERLSTLEDGVMLPKHADKHRVPGVDVSTGSLGQGLSIACGMAAAARIDESGVKVYAVLGDGECNEGQIWEAAMLAAKLRLDNLVAVIDRNGLQLDGEAEKVMEMEPLGAKWQSFGWHVVEVPDGHDFAQIREAFLEARQVKAQPTVIIAQTVKGKGISFMENVVSWHGGSCNPEQLAQGCRDLGLDPEKISWRQHNEH